MAKNQKVFSRTKTLGIKVVYTALSILKENKGELSGKKVMEEVRKRVALNVWEKAKLKKTGYIRWQSVLHFYTIDCIKAGYLLKKKGVWYLTNEGEEALKLGDIALLESAQAAYRKWKIESSIDSDDEEGASGGKDISKTREFTVDEVEQLAMEGIKKHIFSKNPYEFQELVAALFRGMGYYTPFIAPRGKDGGIDLIVYKDPLGTISPRIKVQVKQRGNSATVKHIRELLGTLQVGEDIGIFVSTGGFTSDAKVAARNSQVHMELIDLERFIGLWQEFYEKLSDEDKNEMPLLPIYVLAPVE